MDLSHGEIPQSNEHVFISSEHFLKLNKLSNAIAPTITEQEGRRIKEHDGGGNLIFVTLLK